MRVLVVAGASRTVVEVAVADPDATVADLARALGRRAQAPGLVIDGAEQDAATPLLDAGLAQGCTIELNGEADGAPARPPLAAGPDGAAFALGADPDGATFALGAGPDGARFSLACVAGPHAGRRWALPEGPTVLGRSAWADVAVDDPALSARHCRFVIGGGSIRVSDLGSSAGTWVEGRRRNGSTRLQPEQVLRAGAGAYRVERTPTDRPSPVHVDPRGRMSGTVLFHRPPRAALPSGPDPVPAPAPVDAEPRPLAVGIAAIVIPFVTAALMVVLVGSWLVALLALCGGLATVAAAGEARARRVLQRRREGRRRRVELAVLAGAVDSYRAAERAARWSRVCDPAEAVRRAVGPSTRLWERRPGSADWMLLLVGVADVPLRVPLGVESGRDAAREDLVELLDGRLIDAPVTVRLAERTILGVCGPSEQGRAVARSLVVQASATAGPGDLRVVVLTDPERSGCWEWASWLPHARGGGRGPATVASGVDAARDLVAALDARPDPTPLLVVVDGEHLLAQRGSPARRLLGRAAGGIVLAGAPDRLPSTVAMVVELRADGTAAVTWPSRGERLDGVLPSGLDLDRAGLAARRMARFEDADADDGHSGLPGAVGLLPLLGLGRLDAESVARRWAPPRRPRAVLGATADGVCELDLLADGPHALVAGTTGAGKSELLRSLVLSLALDQSPDRLVFVLVDYKGGSTFDRCARLPHVVGYVTDLDAHLGTRALACLEAELGWRERVLRRHGAADIADLHAAEGHPPAPRLVVVVDEFATMAAELAGFVASLIGIAQRGRSLGVHLVLATQRPGGAVTDDIRANTNVRIALRVQDEYESLDVIGVPDAAHLDRARPGRALLRLGHGDITALQVAHSGGALGSATPAAVTVRGWRDDGTAEGRKRTAEAEPTERGVPTERHGPTERGVSTELDGVVDAIVGAFARSGRPAPRRPWPEPLPGLIPLDDVDDAIGLGDRDGAGCRAVPAGGAPDHVGIGADRSVGGAAPVAPAPAIRAAVVVGVCDEPRAQRRCRLVWDPAAGNLIVAGRPGSGRSTALAAVAAAMAVSSPPSALHLYGVDAGGGGLRCATALPHLAALVTPTEEERLRRMLDRLIAHLDTRLAGQAPALPQIVLLVDGWPGPGGVTDDLAALGRRDDLARLWLEGPPVGISVVATADRLGAVDAGLTAVTAQRWLLQPADDAELDVAGVPRSVRPTFLPGRVLTTDTMLEGQIGWPAATLARAACLWPAAPLPEPVGVLPVVVTLSSLPCPRTSGDGWVLPLGIGDRRLDAVGLVVRPGEHLLVAGPRRSGRSTVVHLIARQLHRLGVPCWSLAPAPPDRDPPPVGSTGAGALTSLAELAEVRAALGRSGRGGALLVDDADAWADGDGRLAELAGDPRSPLTIVAAVRADAARRSYGHWTRLVAASGRGVLLRPDASLDGELLGVRLTDGRIRPRPGLGVIVQDGETEVVQLAVHETH